MNRRGGFILIIVLGALAMMTVLLLALMQGASHQTRGAESSAVLAREKMLADSAVALVIGQIQQASTQPGVAWISQPGLIRTYAATLPRQPLECYKLYSAAFATDTSGNISFLANDVPADWNSTANANLYVDLNAPQQMSAFLGATIYPILDPAALSAVQGLSSDSGAVTMPVRWLYELQDGALGPASNGTKQNPIVGRIAFWTDDDTCKININTAGCGSAWNLPRVYSEDDKGWWTSQPAQGEFSRYPGHPAMTSLIPVFGASTFTPQQLLGLTPRYAWGGSQGGAQPTTAGETVPAKTDRLYASLDELCFGATETSGNQRAANLVTPTQIEQTRFVLTAHSEAPETTLLGEPRVAIWPVADDATKTTATDRAIASDATVGATGAAGTRAYYFQRGDPSGSTDDFAGTSPAAMSNVQLFQELTARGSEAIPGYGTWFLQKYPGAQWTQILLEIADFIRGLNSVDPTGTPFAAANPSTGTGLGFIVPLTMTDPATGATLRGFGRCPTLSSLTLVIYVCGFGFDDGSTIDFTATPDDLQGDAWTAYFNLQSPTNKWKHVTSELLRAFVVPCTFHPGCAFPEVSDACDVQISGLDGLTMSINASNGSISGGFNFPATVASGFLGTPLKVLSADRAWGGNEGPIAWRASGDEIANGTPMTPLYPFAGKDFVRLTLAPNYRPNYSSTFKTMAWSVPSITCSGMNALTVLIRDAKGNRLQSFSVNLPGFTVSAPTINGECDRRDNAPPAASDANWATDSSMRVFPSYYMSLQNRLLAALGNRPLMIQPGDIARGIEAATDLRVIAALPTVTSTFFQGCVNYTGSNPLEHSLRFADGTSALGACGSLQSSPAISCGLVRLAGNYLSTTFSSITGTDYTTGKSASINNPWFTVPACSSPTEKSPLVTMMPLQGGVAAQNLNGDWDTGLGFCPDGAMINLPDAGTSLDPATAYSSLTGGQVGAPTRFAPNALAPSPVIFGSLPAGINPVAPASSEPWRTLLFCPYPAADTLHPGFASPPDHLLLDNFWMPVVEPYAVSTRFATAGKINLNDQIAPFTYLHRNTGFHALLHDLRIPAIPANTALSYKTAGAGIVPAAAGTYWKSVDEDATIAQWESRFANGDAYLSESEICTEPLVPQTTPATTAAGLDLFWNGAAGANRLTGDNLRELPYAQLYSRLTTRSDSYTVHVRVQVLQKLPRDPNQNVWNEGTDLVLGDWRGSYEIERYLDPAATAPAAGQPLGPYRFRIVSARRFAP